MTRVQDRGKPYLCPMHPEVREPNSGKCPKCGMDLLREGTRFGRLRHMVKSPLMLAIMVAIMAAVMIMLMR